MSRPSSTFTDRAKRHALAVATTLALVSASGRAAAQACCAGSGAVSPGRLDVHEDALVALQLRAACVF
jgi:hypothetical protein